MSPGDTAGKSGSSHIEKDSIIHPLIYLKHSTPKNSNTTLAARASFGYITTTRNFTANYRRAEDLYIYLASRLDVVGVEKYLLGVWLLDHLGEWEFRSRCLSCPTI